MAVNIVRLVPRVTALVLVAVQRCAACSFAVANFNMTSDPSRWAFANRYNQRRGPDATQVVGSHDWTFAHNLLSMTGAFTRQPFVSDDGQVLCVFNGEIYNFRNLATELAGDENAYASDGYSLIPAYRKWGASFPSHLEGEVREDV